MNDSRYVIGCDFGTLSMRAVLVRVSDGMVKAEETFTYPDAVITGCLPDGKTKLEGAGWALQNPDDYLNALTRCVPAVVASAGIMPEQVIGICVDFTVGTIMPIDEDGNVLCRLPEFRSRPHAWVKLWKNHTAHKEADAITDYVRENGLDLLDNYGLRASSEYFLPKVWEVLNNDEEIYNRAYTFIEGGDYIVYKLCGRIVRTGVLAASRNFYNNETMSYPDKSFYKGLDPRLENIVEEKHLDNVRPVGEAAGLLTGEMADKLGLHRDVVVCVAHADAAVALPGGGIVKPNVMTFVMGTSTCHMMMAKSMVKIPGMCAIYYGGILPEYYCYEAGQGAVGDIFDWFCQNYIPQDVTDEAAERGVHVMQLMNEKAAKLKIGQSGVAALDWMNGNRSLLLDTGLTGMLAGLTLSTKPEEIYLALIEATAFGTKMIMEQFERYGVPVEEIYACGGLAHKNPLLMQIYSDVLGLPIKLTAFSQTSALSAAIFAAVAAGSDKGGYDNYESAVAAMAPAPKYTYVPVEENVSKYKKLYEIYCQLHDYFGRADDSPMKKLREIRDNIC